MKNQVWSTKRGSVSNRILTCSHEQQQQKKIDRERELLIFGFTSKNNPTHLFRYTSQAKVTQDIYI